MPICELRPARVTQGIYSMNCHVQSFPLPAQSPDVVPLFPNAPVLWPGLADVCSIS